MSYTRSILRINHSFSKVFKRVIFATLMEFLEIHDLLDVLNHGILIQKLINCELTGTSLKLIQSYLSNRTQVISAGFKS